MGGYECIVVGTDFSAAAGAAVSRALTLAHETAHVQVVHWWSAPETSRRDDGHADTDVRRVHAELAAERGRSLLEAHRGERRLSFRAIEGSAVDGLPELAAEKLADLVVVGCRADRGPRGAAPGSVAEAALRRAPCAVLVAR